MALPSSGTVEVMSLALAKGTVVAKRYEILDVIGEGGMGTVYRAKELTLDRIVALKVLKEKLATTTSGLKRFIAEAQTTAKLAHDNIVRVYTIDVWQERPYIAMEFVDGESLESLFSKGIELPIGLQIIEKTARALSAAHGAGLIHRDLKPENILVGGKLNSQLGIAVKVVDWGIAKEVIAPKHLTKTGIVLGTPFYMAPEQIIGAELSAATDYYALGVILFRLLTGHLPFNTKVIAKVIEAHLYEEPPKVRMVVPGVSKELADLTDRLLAKKPSDRPSTVKEIVGPIKRSYGSRAERARQKSVDRTKKSIAPKTQENKRKPYLLGLSILVASLFLVLIFSSYKKTTGRNESSLAVREIELIDVDRVQVRFEGDVPEEGRLVTEQFVLPFPKTGYEAVTRTVRAVELDLPQAILKKTQIRSSESSNDSFLLNPFLLPQVQLLRKYRGDRFRPLFDELNGSSKMDEVLRKAGFEDEFCHWLDGKIEKLLPPESKLNSTEARLLLPLIILEIVHEQRTREPLPWAKIVSRFGVKQEHVDSAESYPRSVPGTLLGRIDCQRYFKNDEGEKKLRCLWIHCPEQVVLAKADPQKYINFLNKLTYDQSVARARVSDWQPVRQETLNLSLPPGTSWPPKKLTMILDTRFFTQDRIVEISFNDGSPYPLFRELGLEEGAIHHWMERCLRTSIPLDPTELRVGENSVEIRSRLLSNKVPLNGTRFEGFAVVVE